MRRLAARWIVVSALALPRVALAQVDPHEGDYTRAAQLRDGDPEGALAIYQSLLAETRGPRPLALLGVLEAQLGRWLVAEEHLAAALAARDVPWVESRRVALTANLEQVRSHLSDLVVVTNAPGASLRVNGTDAGRLPLERGVRAVVGQVTIDLDAPGFEHVRQPVLVTPGQTRVEVVMVATPPSPPPVAVVAPPVRPPPPVVPPPSSMGRLPVGGVVIAGVGVAAFAVAGVFAGLASAAREGCAFDAAADALRCPTPALVTQAERGRDYTDVANGLILGGALAVVGGGVWIAVSLLSGRPRARDGAGLTAAPLVLGSAAGLVVTGPF